MALVRHYTGGSEEYTPQEQTVQVSYSLAGMDGDGVRGQFDVRLLNDEQINQLCWAMAKAAANLPWSNMTWVTGYQHGRRDFTVVDDSIPPTTP